MSRLTASLIACGLAAAAGCAGPPAKVPETPAPASAKQVDCLRLEGFSVPQGAKVGKKLTARVRVVNRGKRPVLLEVFGQTTGWMRIDPVFTPKRQPGPFRVTEHAVKTRSVRTFGGPRKFVLLVPKPSGNDSLSDSSFRLEIKLGSYDQEGTVRCAVDVEVRYYFFGETRQHVKKIRKAFTVKVEK